jgi:hypothetical protein
LAVSALSATATYASFGSGRHFSCLSSAWMNAKVPIETAPATTRATANDRLRLAGSGNRPKNECELNHLYYPRTNTRADLIDLGIGGQSGLPMGAAPLDPSLRFGHFLRGDQLVADQVTTVVFPNIRILETLQWPPAHDCNQQTDNTT